MFAVGAAATMAGVELGFHRYFAHRSFTARPALVWVLGALGSSAFLGPVMWWVAMHRRHHAVTDREGDPHSPHWPVSGARGLVHAHVGWLFRPEHTAMTDLSARGQGHVAKPAHGCAAPQLPVLGRAGVGDSDSDRVRRRRRARRSHGLPVGRDDTGVCGDEPRRGPSIRSATRSAAARSCRTRGAHATASGWCYPPSAAVTTPTTMTPRARTPLARAGGRSMSAARCCAFSALRAGQ